MQETRHRIDMTNNTSPCCYSYIRFSSPEQFKSDSLHRQVELSERYAAEKGLTLDRTLSMKDLALSAFNGAHKSAGTELYKFLKLIELGKIAPGSVLLVESLDRLSREQILDALQQFLGIIEAGISIVTLCDGMEYTKAGINQRWEQLIISLAVMSRAHEESLMKSKRIGAAWANKRQSINNRKLTAKAPAWLSLSDDKKEFRKISERCRLIERIFEMSCQGLGSEKITKTLNRENTIKGWPKSGWRKSYVEKILRNRSVIGEFQPHIKKNGKRVPVGEPIQGYFPQVVSEELFYGAQQHRNHSFGGKTGKVLNLFAHLAKCGHCGAPMQFINKGTHPTNGGSYLICDNARRGRGCNYHSWKYPEFEKLVLEFCKGLRVDDLMDNDERTEKETALTTLSGELIALNGKLDTVSQRVTNLIEQVADTASKSVRKVLEAKLEQFLNEKGELEADKKKIERNLAELRHTTITTESNLTDLRELLKFMREQNGNEEKNIDVRLKLKHKLRQLIEKIEVYPIGHSSRSSNKKLRQFVIYFVGGSYRVIKPNSEPRMTLAYEHEEQRVYHFSNNANGGLDIESEPVGMEDEIENTLTTIIERTAQLKNKKT